MTHKYDVCFYHAGCMDGLASAAILYNAGMASEYLPLAYNDRLPDLSGKRVIFVDFTPAREKLDLQLLTLKELTIVDHHVSALAYMRLLSLKDNVNIVFPSSEDECGASLTWKMVHPNEELPELLLFVKDRDLWTKKSPDTAPLHEALMVRCRTVEDMSAVLARTLKNIADDDDYEQHLVPELIKEGEILCLSKQVRIAEHAKTIGCLWVGHQHVLTANVPPELSSDFCEYLYTANPQEPFVSCYSIDAKTRLVRVSLRSAKGQTNVAEVAKKYGGGGHENSAGFYMSLDQLSGLSSIP